MPYKPPGPPPKTGKHRYVFLVFALKNGTTEPLQPIKQQDHQHWGIGKKGGGIREWASENGLVLVAANFLYAKNERQQVGSTQSEEVMPEDCTILEWGTMAFNIWNRGC